jgi:hypothetical protein
MSALTRVLLSLEITTPTTVWNRTLYTSYIPTCEELEFYYSKLLEIQDVRVNVSTEAVPEDFNSALLLTRDSAPTSFPVYDLETAVADTQRRDQYMEFIKRLCDMERSRAVLRGFTAAAKSTPHVLEVPVDYEPNRHILQNRAWVNELLKSLNEDFDFEDASADSCTDIVTATKSDEFIPIGWVFTPTAADVREKKGSRIVLDADIGKKWERLLGSDLFPDMIVSRRINTVNWAFQHPTSDALVRATLDWYIAAHDSRIQDGISDWVVDADRELNALFSTFKKIKVNERLIMESLPKSTDKYSQVFKILSSMETQLLASSLEDPSIAPLEADLYRKYCIYMFRGMGIDREVYQGNDNVKQIWERWERSKLGFKHNGKPFVEAWAEMWNLVMRGKVTHERLVMFLRTLDCWDPMESSGITSLLRSAIASEWVRIFIDNETVLDDKGKIRSPHLQSHIKEYCYKYLPEAIFPTNFSPMIVGPVLAKFGFTSVKTKIGRFTYGLRYKNPPPESEMATVETPVVKSTKVVNVVTETAEDSVSEKKMFTQTVLADNGSTRIEHYFSATQEIHLGNL